MAKKVHNFTVLSDKVCEERFCRKKLKQRLVDQKASHNITRCYVHHIQHRRLTQHKGR